MVRVNIHRLTLRKWLAHESLAIGLTYCCNPTIDLDPGPWFLKSLILNESYLMTRHNFVIKGRINWRSRLSATRLRIISKFSGLHKPENSFSAFHNHSPVFLTILRFGEPKKKAEKKAEKKASYQRSRVLWAVDGGQRWTLPALVPAVLALVPGVLVPPLPYNIAA